MKRIFVTGISTEVGKTLASAIIVEALQADYWKPIQAGELESSDSLAVKRLISNPRSVIHPEAYRLRSPMSPHAAAQIDATVIDLARIKRPKTNNHLVIEGAGGLLVPLNEKDTILDLILPGDSVIVISRHYLGSINHTLLTLERLARNGHNAYLLFNGDPHPATEDVILKMSGVPSLGRIAPEASVDARTVRKYAEILAVSLRQV